MREADVKQFEAARRGGAACFDTRTKGRFEEDGLPGTTHLDLADVQAGWLPPVAPDTPIYLICERGQTSELVGLYLEAAGFSDVHNVTGGMIAWRRSIGTDHESENS